MGKTPHPTPHTPHPTPYPHRKTFSADPKYHFSKVMAEMVMSATNKEKWYYSSSKVNPNASKRSASRSARFFSLSARFFSLSARFCSLSARFFS